jgi:hypothetical protein
MEWTDDDLEKLAEESDYQTFLSVFKVLSQEKRKKYEQEGKKLEQKMVECKAKWKKIQL